MNVALVSIVVGVIIGFTAQRARFCLVGGFRDVILARDTYLLKGFFGLLAAAAIFFFIFGTLRHSLENYPQFMKAGTDLTIDQLYKSSVYPCDCSASVQFITRTVNGLTMNWGAIQMNNLMLFTALGAFVIGLLSVLANGCPLRQHVKAASGNKSAWLYLAGFYCGILVYQLFLSDIFRRLLQ